jgi:hypothetical protein
MPIHTKELRQNTVLLEFSTNYSPLRLRPGKLIQDAIINHQTDTAVTQTRSIQHVGQVRTLTMRKLAD